MEPAMTMRVWKAGDRSKGVCERCGRLVATRFERRTMALERPRTEVPDVLVAVCEACESLVAIPPQSLPRLNEGRRRELVKIEARLSKEMEDLLGWIAAKYAGRLDAFRGALIRFYLHEMAHLPELTRRVKCLADSEIAGGRQEERFQVRLEKPLLDRAWAAAQSAGIVDKSDMIRGLILAAAEDAEQPNSPRQPALAALAVAAAN
jgi:hypothetical protein